MLSLLKRLARDESGATALEYGLICALIFLVAVSGMTVFGNNASGVFIGAANAINSVK